MQRQNVIKWLKALSYIGIYGGLLMPLFFWPIVIFPFVFSKLAYFQVLIGLTFPAYVALAWMEPRFRPRRSMLYLAIAAYFVALTASTVFSVDPLRSWWGNQERMNGLFTLLHLFAWLTMTIGVVKNWEGWRRLLNYEVGLSAFMAIVALLQRPFPKLLMFPAGDRIGGLLDNPIYMGSYQIFNLFFILLLWMKGPATRNAKIAYGIIALLDIAAFFGAQSRGAFAGLAVGLFVFAISFAVMTPNRKARRIVLACVASVFLAYGLLVTFRHTALVQNSPFVRFTSFTATRTRLIAWEIAWKGFLERPLVGWGFDAFHVLFNKKYNPESLRYSYYETWFDRSHNTIMDVVSMTGLFGLVTFTAIWITLIVSVIAAYRKKWMDVPTASVLLALPGAYFVQNLFVFDHPAAFSMSYLLYAFVIASTHPSFNLSVDPAAAATSKEGRKAPLVAFAVLQAFALFVVWRATVLPFRASILSIRSNTEFSNGNYEQAYRLAAQAAEIPTPYLDEQTFLQARNYITLAGSGQLQKLPYWREWHDLITRVTEKHIQEHPENVHPHFIYARFADSMSAFVPEDALIAEREYLRTIELSPKRQQMHFSYARFLISRGRPDEALELYKQAVSFDPTVGEARWQLGIHLMFDRQQLQEGARELAMAVSSTAPYTLIDARDALALSLAYDVLGEREKLRGIIDILPTLPQAPLEVYIQIAQAMERQGLIEERDRILQALVKLDSTLALRLMPLTTGVATSIAAALQITQDDIVTVPPATTTPATPPSNGGGGGPRR